MTDYITFEEYFDDTSNTAIYPGAYDPPHNKPAVTYLGLGLAGEAGEVANKVKKIFRDNNDAFSRDKLDAIQEELGDCLWYLCQLHIMLDLSLEDTLNMNLQKLSGRYNK